MVIVVKCTNNSLIIIKLLFSFLFLTNYDQTFQSTHFLLSNTVMFLCLCFSNEQTMSLTIQAIRL